MWQPLLHHLEEGIALVTRWSGAKSGVEVSGGRGMPAFVQACESCPRSAFPLPWNATYTFRGNKGMKTGEERTLTGPKGAEYF